MQASPWQEAQRDPRHERDDQQADDQREHVRDHRLHDALGVRLSIALAAKNPIPTGGANSPTPIASTATIA